MIAKPITYLISGQVCSGKTSTAKLLEERTGSIRFTPDEWMLKLFPDPVKCEKFDEIFYKCCDLSWDTAKKCLMKKMNVILDFGFWKKTDRDRYKRMLSELGFSYRLIYVKCDDAIIRKRLGRRNRDLPENTFFISEDDYNFYSPGFEEPVMTESPLVFDNSHEGGMNERFARWAKEQLTIDGCVKS